MTQPNNPFTSPSGKRVTCLEMLQLILDGEATEEQRDFFKAHMDGCGPCFKTYEVDMAIKQLLKDRCCGDAPDGLVGHIRAQIAQKKS